MLSLPFTIEKKRLLVGGSNRRRGTHYKKVEDNIGEAYKSKTTVTNKQTK